jgi:hypothetical protein
MFAKAKHRPSGGLNLRKGTLNPKSAAERVKLFGPVAQSTVRVAERREEKEESRGA